MDEVPSGFTIHHEKGPAFCPLAVPHSPSEHLQVSTTHVTSPVQGRRSRFRLLFSISGLEVDGTNLSGAPKYRLIHRLSLNCRLWTSFQTVRNYKRPVIFSPSAVRSRDFSECNGSVSQQTRCLRRGWRQTAANRCVIGRGRWETPRRGRRQSAWRRGCSHCDASLQSHWHNPLRYLSWKRDTGRLATWPPDLLPVCLPGCRLKLYLSVWRALTTGRVTAAWAPLSDPQLTKCWLKKTKQIKLKFNHL